MEIEAINVGNKPKPASDIKIFDLPAIRLYTGPETFVTLTDPQNIYGF